MRNIILTTLTLARRLVHPLTDHPVGKGGGGLLPPSFSPNRHGGLTTTFAAIAVLAAIPQCNRGQAPMPEPAQVPITEPVQPPETEPTQTPAVESVQTPAAEPEAIVSALIDAMDANDAERIRSLFDANASQAYGDGPAKSGEAFFRWLDSDIIQREGRVENAQLAVSGNEVVVIGQYQSRGYTSEANFLLTVENGRITSWRMRY